MLETRDADKSQTIPYGENLVAHESDETLDWEVGRYAALMISFI